MQTIMKALIERTLHVSGERELQEPDAKNKEKQAHFDSVEFRSLCLFEVLKHTTPWKAYDSQVKIYFTHAVLCFQVILQKVN